MKLMIGSFGTLGFITSANFKVFPRPQQTATFVCEFYALKEAVAFRDQIVASPLAHTAMAFEIVSSRAHEYLAPPSAPADPDHWHPVGGVAGPAPWTVLVRAAGSAAVIARYRRELSGSVSRELHSEAETQQWRWLSDFEAGVFARHQNAMLLQVSTPIGDVAAVLERAEETALNHNFVCAAIGRMTVGSLFLAFVPLAVDPPSAMQFAGAVSALRGCVDRHTSVIVPRCPTEAKRHFDVWGTTPTDWELMRRMRQTLDPKRILNRGRFLIP